MLREFFSNDTSTTVDEQISAILAAMKRAGVDSEEYPKLIGYLERLTDVKDKVVQKPVSRDTIALIGGNLLGILLIVAYEQRHVMTSQGFRQIIRPR